MRVQVLRLNYNHLQQWNYLESSRTLSRCLIANMIRHHQLCVPLHNLQFENEFHQELWGRHLLTENLTDALQLGPYIQEQLDMQPLVENFLIHRYPHKANMTYASIHLDVTRHLCLNILYE